MHTGVYFFLTFAFVSFGIIFGTIQTPSLYAQTQPCHLLQSNGGSVASDFGVPWNVFSLSKELLISIQCETSFARALVGDGQQTQYIYHTGYRWDGIAWQQISFEGVPTASAQWFLGNAQSTLSYTQGKQYLLAYVCQYVQGAWRCGCKDAQCTKPAWQLQAFERPTEVHTQVGSAIGQCTLPSIAHNAPSAHTVGTGAPQSCTESSLRQELAKGGTILFNCGTAKVTIPITQELFVTKPTIIDGGKRVTLDGMGKVRILRNQSQLTVKNMAFTRGYVLYEGGNPNGGGAINSTYGKTLTVVNSSFFNNTTNGFGGAIFQAGNGKLTLVNSLFENNEGGGGGAVYNILAGLEVVNTTFRNNRGVDGGVGGGGLMTDGASAQSGKNQTGGSIKLCGTLFASNSARATGGGAYLYAYQKDIVQITNTTFTDNIVTPNTGGVSMGGGLRLGTSAATIVNSQFKQNAAKTGAGVATEGKGQTTIEDTAFTCHTSDTSGGNIVKKNVTSIPSTSPQCP